MRLFTFGVGYDVNTILLDTLAEEHHGASTYVQPEEDIETAVASFYDKISLPVLTDVHLDMGQAPTSDVFPFPLPDIFSGGQLVVVGRYREGGSTTVTLSGTRNGATERLVYNDFSLEKDGGSDFIPRLWATRKIGHLLTQIRLHGAEGELIDEIVELSVRYGIVTPYTSFLVDETEDALSREGRQALADQALNALMPPARGGVGGGGGPAAAPTVSGQAAVEKSVAEEALRSAEAAVAPQSALVRTVGPKSFVLRGETWVDTAYEAAAMSAEKSPGSERYFALLASTPELGRYLAVGRT